MQCCSNSMTGLNVRESVDFTAASTGYVKRTMRVPTAALLQVRPPQWRPEPIGLESDWMAPILVVQMTVDEYR